MIVLHAGLADGRLLLWGETPLAGEPAVPARKRGRQPKVPAAQPLPYDAGEARLREGLEAAGLTDGKGAAEPVTAWLPTLDGTPVASSPLVAEPPEASGTAVLAPWTVTALALSPGQAVDLLCACVDHDTLAPGVIVGKTLAFWAAALRFAG